MRTLNLSGLKAGDSLNISVSQGAITAGPVNVPAWGGTAPSGAISIIVHRSERAVAPDSVGFMVDLSESDFDTPGPGAGEFYDARMHDLVYIWDFDDAANPTWSHPERYLSGWNDRNRAIGPSVQHVYLDARPSSLGAGNGYSPGVLVIEPSSGKWASATVEIFVDDPDVVFSGANTVLVNPVEDDDWTWADANMPTADQVNISDFSRLNSEVIARQGSTPKRYLFKRGAEFDMHFNIGGVHPQLLAFGAYGNPADPLPILRGIAGGAVDEAFAFRLAIITSSGPVPEFKFTDLDIRGNWDDEKWNGYYHESINTDTRALYAAAAVDILAHNVTISGFRIALGAGWGTAETRRNRIHFDDVTIDDFGGQYPVLVPPVKNSESSISMTGLKFRQSPAGNGYTFGSPLSRGNGSLIRYESFQRSYFACSEFFSKDGLYHILKFNNRCYTDGYMLNVHHLYGEGGNGFITQSTNTVESPAGQRRSHAGNTIIDGVIYVGNENCEVPFQTLDSGYTLRNALYIQPKIRHWVNRHSAFLKVMAMDDVVHPSYDPMPAHVLAAPIASYNCAMGYYLDKDHFDPVYNTQPRDPVWGLEAATYSTTRFTNVDYGMNSYVYAPNLSSPITSDGPFTSNILFTARSLGYKSVMTRQGPVTLSVAVAPGGTVFVPYGDLNINGWGGTAQQSYFAGTQGNAFFYVNGAAYNETLDLGIPNNSAIEVSYGATGATVTNVSGTTWPSGAECYMDMNMGPTGPVLTDWAPGPIYDTKPGTGSPLLGAATTGHRAFMDITGQMRRGGGIYSDTSAVDKGPWEVA